MKLSIQLKLSIDRAAGCLAELVDKTFVHFSIALFMQITKMTLTQILNNFQAKIFKIKVFFARS